MHQTTRNNLICHLAGMLSDRSGRYNMAQIRQAWNDVYSFLPLDTEEAEVLAMSRDIHDSDRSDRECNDRNAMKAMIVNHGISARHVRGDRYEISIDGVARNYHRSELQQYVQVLDGHTLLRRAVLYVMDIADKRTPRVGLRQHVFVNLGN